MKQILQSNQKCNFTINAVVKATIQNGDLDFSKPKINIDIMISEINGFLESKQYQGTIDFASWLMKKINHDKYKVNYIKEK
jgi:hypothetical protein